MASLGGELQALLETSAVKTDVTEGSVFAAEFNEKEGEKMALREGQLNSLLGKIMEALQEDVPKSWLILEEFKVAAKERFGQTFHGVNAAKIEAPKVAFSSARLNPYLSRPHAKA